MLICEEMSANYIGIRRIFVIMFCVTAANLFKNKRKREREKNANTKISQITLKSARTE